jgi:hypothetical protein
LLGCLTRSAGAGLVVLAARHAAQRGLLPSPYR